MGVVTLLFTTALPNRGEGLLSLEPGKKLPHFAAPLALGRRRATRTSARSARARTGPERCRRAS